MRDAKIVVATVDEQDVDDTILTSGKVAFDDTRVAHVFSPVNGRVTRIDAALGERVKKGDAARRHRVAGHRHRVERRGQGEGRCSPRPSTTSTARRISSISTPSRSGLRDRAGQLRQGEGGARSRARQKLATLRGGGSGQVTQSFALTAPIDGEVIARNVSPGIEVQGQYGGGTAVELFTIGELDKVWVLADVYEMDLARVKRRLAREGEDRRVPDKVFESKLDWVAGTLDRVDAHREGPLHVRQHRSPAQAGDVRDGLRLGRREARRSRSRTTRSSASAIRRSCSSRSERRRTGASSSSARPVTVDEGEGGKWVPVDHGVEKGQTVVVSGGILLCGMM